MGDGTGGGKVDTVAVSLAFYIGGGGGTPTHYYFLLTTAFNNLVISLCLRGFGVGVIGGRVVERSVGGTASGTSDIP